MSDWPRRWHFINGLIESFSQTERELMELLRKPYYCARCGRNDLPLALFFEHDSNCRFESAINRSSCDMQDEIDELKAVLEELRPPEYRCWKCKGVFDMEHIRMYGTYYTTCKWCFKHLPPP